MAEIKSDNSIAFEKNYWSCKVVVEGEIKEITSSKIINGTYYSWTITVEGGNADWFIGKGQYSESDVDEDFLATLNVGDTVKISTKGYGHGVGMSQYGANHYVHHIFRVLPVLVLL